jgi:phospholipid/cholesterol/gamma-HCH transport system substrate-binding protein
MTFDADNKARLAFGLVLLVLAAGGLAWYAIAESAYSTYQIVTRDPVSGLIPDAPVEFHGVEIGRVKKVELTTPDSVRILLAIRDDAPISAATTATITSRGLATRGFTGYVYVSLEDAGTERAPIKPKPGEDYPTLPVAASRTVNLDLAIDQVNRNVQQITEALEATLDPKTIAALKQSADSLQHVSKSLQTQVLPEAQKSLARLDELTTSMAGVAKKIDRDPSVMVRGTGKRPLGPGEK